MAIDHDRLIDHDIPASEHTYTERDPVVLDQGTAEVQG